MNRSSSLRLMLCPIPRISVAMSVSSCPTGGLPLGCASPVRSSLPASLLRPPDPLCARRSGGDAALGDLVGRGRLFGVGRARAVAGVLPGGPLDGLHDVHVARAAAD